MRQIRDDAAVFLGLKSGVDPAAMKKDLLDGESEGKQVATIKAYVR